LTHEIPQEEEEEEEEEEEGIITTTTDRGTHIPARGYQLQTSTHKAKASQASTYL
jgi:hypothetical protein